MDGTSYNLTGLMEYERYNVSVIALTDKGEGEESKKLYVLTEEHCKFNPKLSVRAFA